MLGCGDLRNTKQGSLGMPIEKMLLSDDLMLL